MNSLPYTPSDATAVMNSDKFVAGRRHVKVRLLFVDEKRVRHPDIFDELRADAQRFDSLTFFVSQSRIRPKLTEVKIQREVLLVEMQKNH